MALPSVPVLHLKNVPRGVQFFPMPEQFSTDAGIDITVWQCDGCGLVQLRGDSVVYSQHVTAASSYSPAMIAHRHEQAGAFVIRFELEGKTVLDVGCGDGHFLSLLSECGAVGFGIDPSRSSVELGQYKGLSIQQGFITRESKVRGSPFDAFVMLHVLEHVSDPNDLLQGIYTNLSNEAVGLIEVPSFEQIIEEQRFYDFIPDHVSYFSTKTLRFVLEKNGFDVLEMYRDWQGEHIVALVKKRITYDFRPMQQAIVTLGEAFNSFVQANTSTGKRIAIWGASCQSLMLLATSHVRDVSYVIDSALYKQGRFTPVSHLPIVAPDTLQRDPVDIIIVIAPRYAHEIIAQARREFRFEGTIAVLKGTNIEIVQDVNE